MHESSPLPSSRLGETDKKLREWGDFEFSSRKESCIKCLGEQERGRKAWCKVCVKPNLMAGNVEAVNVFSYIIPFMGENMELPSCLPWLIETLDVVADRWLLEKFLVLHNIFRNEVLRQRKEAWHQKR